MTSRRQSPALCYGCMETVRIAGLTLNSSSEAVRLAWQNGLLREGGEDLVSLDEHRQCMAEDADEIAELRTQLEAAQAELRELRAEKTEKKTKIQTR